MRYSRVGLCEGNGSAGLSVDQSAQSGLALDDTVWDTHLAAQSRQEHHQLNNNIQITSTMSIYSFNNSRNSSKLQMLF